MSKGIVHTRFILRELLHGWRQGVLFILCAALSLATIAALNSFKGGVHRSLFHDARALHGGDIIVHSHYPFSPGLAAEIDRLARQDDVTVAATLEFYSVVRVAERTLFAKIKAVDGNYPLYGRIDLASGRALPEVLASGSCVVAEEVLARLNLQPGDELQIGGVELRIADVVTYESDSPVDFLSFGPRVFVAEADVERIGLVKKGSRVAYEILIRVGDERRIEKVAAGIRGAALADQERISTYRDADSRLKRFFDNLLFFLSLIALFTLLLAGLGMQSCLRALLAQKEKTIAICRALGATSSFLHRQYLIMVLLLGTTGLLLGIAAGGLLAALFQALFAELLPMYGGIALHPGDVGESLLIGLAAVLLFTFLPLHRLRNITPLAIFRKERIGLGRDLTFAAVAGTGGLLVVLLVIRQLEDVRIGLLFMAGLLAFVALIALAAALLFGIARKLPLRRLSLRQAVRSMTRAGNATRSIIITLSAALSLLFSIYLIEGNLHRTYIESYPEDAPNLFFLDIQPSQRQGFSAFFEKQPPLYPVIRARLVAINGEEINREEELRKKRDNFAREFNLTYRDHLLADEILIEGDSLFPAMRDGRPELQVSILDTVLEMGDVKLHDRLLFNIQGIELEAQVTSIRSRTESRLYPFFYFVFPEEYLEDAPKTFFSAVQVERRRMAALQNRIVEKYPNISFINVAAAAENIGLLMDKLSAIVNFFASFSIAAGGLILISAILATRIARTREAVYYKILGGKTSFVYRIFIYENGFIGLASAAVALVFAQCASWAVCRYIFEIPYDPHGAASLVLAGGTVLLVVAVGLAASLGIVRQKPARFLREYGNG